MAMKRNKAEPLIEDVAICLTMGWTYSELMRQPAEFIERLQIYLNTQADIQERERRDLESKLEDLKRGRP